MRGKCKFLLNPTLIVLLIMSTAINLNLINVSPSNAIPPPTLSITYYPSTTKNSSIGEYAPGSTFTVQINIANCPYQVFGYEFKLKYKPSVLNATYISHPVGSTAFFPPIVNPPGSGTYLFKNETNNDLGYAWYSVTLSTGPGKTVGSTPKTLALITFTVKAPGGSVLYLFDTTLSGAATTTIAHNAYGAHFVYGYGTVHDIGITSVMSSANKSLPPASGGGPAAVKGETFNVTVVARNHGNSTETFNVAVYANATALGAQTVYDLVGGATTTLTFIYNSAGLTLGKYIVSANATTVQDETDTTDNTLNKILRFQPPPPVYVYVTIAVIDYPIAAFKYSREPLSNPFTLPFANQTMLFNASESNPVGGEIVQWNWDFAYRPGGTAISYVNWFKPTYPHEGTYNATLTVTDSEGLTSKLVWKQITIYLYDVAVINVTTSLTEVTKPNPVSINVTVKSAGYARNPTYGLNSTFQVTPYYGGTPIANPQTVTNLTAGANKTLTFTWDTRYVPATTAGTPYQISANASMLSSKDNEAEANKTNNGLKDGIVTVIKPEGPSANFTYSPKNPIEGQPVNFNASLSTPNPLTLANITSYAWDFGDHTTEIYAGANLTDTATHSYAQGGSYHVTLNVTDSEGKSDAAEAYVTVFKHDVAVVKVTLGVKRVRIGDTVPINVTVTNEGDFNETFNVNIYANSTQIYTKKVTLTIQNTTNVGFIWNTTGVASGNATIKAEIPPLPTEADIKDNTLNGTLIINKWFSLITLIVSPSNITLGESTTISGAISPKRESADVTIVYRKNGTQTWSTIKTVATNSTSKYSYTWTPTTYGTFELNSSWPGDAITLKAQSGVKTLLVKSPPIASFTYIPSAPIAGDNVTFTSNSTDLDGSIQSWTWNFGDGTSGNGETVTHTYTTAGDFAVNLTVTDNDGLTNTKTITITVGEKPTNIFIYLVAAIGAIVIIAIGIAAYSRLKKKP